MFCTTTTVRQIFREDQFLTSGFTIYLFCQLSYTIISFCDVSHQITSFASCYTELHFAQFIFRLKWANNCKGWQRDKENAVNDCIMKSQITNTILTTLNYIEEIFCNTGTKQIKATLLTLGPLSLGVINTFTIQKRRKYIACMYSKDDRGISQICAPLWGQVTLHASAMGVQQHQHRVVMWINSKHQTQLSTTSHVLFAMKRYLHTFAQQQIVMWARRLCVIKTSFVNSFEIFMIFLLYQQYHLNTFSTSLSLSLYF